ncbi:MAG: hypothetical protein ABJC26_18685, partial [Gemmatimonadaceae bacterium]
NKLQANPKPIMTVAGLVVVLILAIVMILALKPPKPVAITQQQQQQLQSAPTYAELPPAQNAMSMQSPADSYSSLEPPRQVVLAPMATSAERAQAIATIDQRPDAALRVTKNWLRG